MTKARDEYNRRKGKLDHLTSQKTSLESEKLELEKELTDEQKILDFLAVLSDNRRKEVIQSIEKLTTKALRTVFKRDDYELVLDITEERKSLACRTYLISDFNGKRIKISLMEGHGGGIWDVTSFILRVVCILILGYRRVLVLDEPFRSVNLKKDQLHSLGAFIKKLCEDLNFQIIMVSTDHIMEEYSSKYYEFKLDKDGYTYV